MWHFQELTECWYHRIFSLLYFLLLLLGCAHIIFLCVLTHSSCKGPNGLSLLHYRIISYILSGPIFHVHWLSVAHFHLFFHIFCTGGFYWSYQCDALSNLSWWPIPVQQITAVLFLFLNHFWKTLPSSIFITFPGISLMNYPCIFFPYQFCLSSFAFCFLNSSLVTVSSVLMSQLQQPPWWGFLQNWQHKNPNYFPLL